MTSCLRFSFRKPLLSYQSAYCVHKLLFWISEKLNLQKILKKKNFLQFVVVLINKIYIFFNVNALCKTFHCEFYSNFIAKLSLSVTSEKHKRNNVVFPLVLMEKSVGRFYYCSVFFFSSPPVAI